MYRAAERILIYSRAPLIKAANDGDGTAGYFFYDLNAKINHKFSSNDRLYLSAYLGDDKFYANSDNSYIQDNQKIRDRSENGFRWGNLTAALRWNHVFNNKLFSNATLTRSRYRFNIYLENQFEEIVEEKKQTTYSKGAYLSGIQDLAAKIDFDYIPSPRHYVRFGASATNHVFTPGASNSVFKNADVQIDTTLGVSRTDAMEYAAYIEDDMELTNRLKVNAGLHLAGFSVDGTFYKSLQPRISARYLVNDRLSVKASYATMTQFIHLLTNSRHWLAYRPVGTGYRQGQTAASRSICSRRCPEPWASSMR